MSDGWGEFPNTILWFSGQTHVDLRLPVTPDVVEGLRSIGLARPFGIVTADNPRGHTRPAAENVAAREVLMQDITARRLSYLPLHACNADGTHCEVSFAVRGDRETILVLACRYQQLAIFWFDGAKFWIIPALGDADATALPT